MGEKKICKSICRMCGSGCGIEVTVEDNKVVRISGDKDNHINRGRICIKGSSAVTWLNLPERLTKPLKKTADGFVEIPLEQAMDEIAGKMLELQKKYGKQAVAGWKGEGTGFDQNEGLMRRFNTAIGSPNYFSNNTQCNAGRFIAFHLNYGCWPQADFRNTNLAIFWGTNSPAAHSYWTQDLNEGREKGAKSIVVDVKYNEQARIADLFVVIRPGTDAVLGYCIINEMIEKQIVNMEFIEKYTIGFDELKEYAKQFTKEYTSEVTGVPVETIDQMVQMIKEAGHKVCSWPGCGLEHQSNGVSNSRVTSMIDCLVGAIDQKGGMLINENHKRNALTLYDEVTFDIEPIGRSKYPIFEHFRKESHTLMLMDTILTGKYEGKDYPFKGLVLTAGDPVMTEANSAKTRKALSSLELFVVKDLFMTETAKLADYVLPAASNFERDELYFNGIEQSAYLAAKCIESDLQTEYEFYKGLADRMGAGSYFPWKDEKELINYIMEPSGYDYDYLKAHPSGVQACPVRYMKHEERFNAGEKPFPTPTGKIELSSTLLKQYGYPGIPTIDNIPSYVKEKDEEYPWACTTGARKVYYFHGRYRNIPQIKKAHPYGVAEMNDEDAKMLQLKEGDKIRVTSRIGQIEIPVHIMEYGTMAKGAIQITHGYLEANANLLTDDTDCCPISGFPSLKCVNVKIEKI